LRWLIATCLGVLAAVIQLAVLPFFPLWGSIADVQLAAVLGMAAALGMGPGVLTAFAGGLILDVFLGGHGLWCTFYSIMAVLMAQAAQREAEPRWLYLIICAAGGILLRDLAILIIQFFSGLQLDAFYAYLPGMLLEMGSTVVWTLLFSLVLLPVARAQEFRERWGTLR